ncbi:beta family protein [Streptomyces sp. NPDC002835]
MVEPLYVPVLPMRRSAVTAYGQLHPQVRRHIAPLWTVPPHTGPERARGTPAPPHPGPDDIGRALHRWLTPRADHLIEVTAGLPGWLDAAHVEGEVHGAAVALRNLATRSGLTLVTGPERHPALQRYTADLAFAGGRGLGVRVLVDEPPDEPCTSQMLDLVSRLCKPPAQLDLLLDVGAVNDPAEAGKRSLMALDLLGTLMPWRSVTLLSGAFPDHDPAHDPALFTPPRLDQALHAQLRAARPRQRVHYGDYSVEHVRSANRPADSGRYGPPWSLLRYTLPDRFLVARAPTRGPERADRVRSTVRRIVEHESYRRERSAHRGAAEDWLESCAYGAGPVGTGTPEIWTRIGHAQHLTHVARRLLDGDSA